MPKPGYSIVNGQVAKCQSPCMTCTAYDPALCTSCFSRYVNVRGSCLSCTDPYALTCSPQDLSFSYSCQRGYVAGYYSINSTYGGQCLPCAAYCRFCFKAGPGKCDPQGCYSGSVQLTGTTNCSKCFKGCSECNSNNPTECLSCS